MKFCNEGVPQVRLVYRKRPLSGNPSYFRGPCKASPLMRIISSGRFSAFIIYISNSNGGGCYGLNFKNPLGAP